MVPPASASKHLAQTVYFKAKQKPRQTAVKCVPPAEPEQGVHSTPIARASFVKMVPAVSRRARTACKMATRWGKIAVLLVATTSYAPQELRARPTKTALRQIVIWKLVFAKHRAALMVSSTTTKRVSMGAVTSVVPVHYASSTKHARSTLIACRHDATIRRKLAWQVLALMGL